MGKMPFAYWPWTPELVAKFARANAGRKVRGVGIYDATVEGHIVAHDHDCLALFVGDGRDTILNGQYWKVVSSFGGSRASKVLYPRDLEFCDEHGPHSRPFEGMPPMFANEYWKVVSSFGSSRAMTQSVQGQDGKMYRFAREAGAPNAKQLTVKVDAKDALAEVEKRIEQVGKRIEPLKRAYEMALSLIRDLPTRHLDAPMRARAREVERALAEALLPVSGADQRGMDERDRPGDACARMVVAYDD